MKDYQTIMVHKALLIEAGIKRNESLVFGVQTVLRKHRLKNKGIFSHNEITIAVYKKETI